MRRLSYCILLLFSLASVSRVSAKGFVLSIGLSALDPNHYGTNIQTLSGPEQDASDMLDTATKSLQCKGQILLNKKATRSAVFNSIQLASSDLVSNDIFIVFFSGHGGEIPDSKADAKNGMDQTWCLFDAQLLDRELYSQWATFREGVRIVVISDSCHSEGISKLMFDAIEVATLTEHADDKTNNNILDYVDPDTYGLADTAIERENDRRNNTERLLHRKVKSLSVEKALSVWEKNKDFYLNLIAHINSPSFPIPARVLSMSACEDDKEAADAGDFRNSVFTSALLSIWDGAQFQGSYIFYFNNVRDQASTLNPKQIATRRMIDKNDDAFWGLRPYTSPAP